MAVGVRESLPKFMPKSVTDEPALATALKVRTLLITGASYEKPCILVPTTAETVTAALIFTETPAAGNPVLWHTTCVSVTHTDDAHMVLVVSTSVGLTSDGPKLRPFKVKY
jgi:hypothetical protein